MTSAGDPRRVASRELLRCACAGLEHVGRSAMNAAARYFPHHAAGFRSNPFRALTDAEWSDTAVVGAEIQAAFGGTDAHLQVLGGIGAGKTTTLLGLRRQAEAAGVCAAYEYLAEGSDRLTADPATCTLLLLDEAQRLSQPQLARLLDRCSRPFPERRRGLPDPGRSRLRLVVATHEDLTVHFAARGLPLVTASVDHLSAAGWRAILDARLAAAALPGRPRATLSDNAVTLLMHTFGADRRAAIAMLYEVFQRLRAPIRVEADDLRSTLRGLEP